MQTYGEWRQRAVNQPNLEEPSTQINTAGCRRIRSTSVEAVYCLCSDGEGYDDVTVPPSMRSFFCSAVCEVYAAVFEFFAIFGLYLANYLRNLEVFMKVFGKFGWIFVV